ncbi:hypothetical protein BJB45_12970 [Halomonas huangheensis]|uniref:Uncharacterized protein n=1 Tax=Halomonas huangheensis TaxID=1178482 RepID=W1N7N1_9GAMM|nr:hypothetical protein AR456_14155 [Halomonas huangheensis]ERL51562.1 hypothetical protein BJB45_12970 [Halomonas huangheensis]
MLRRVVEQSRDGIDNPLQIAVWAGIKLVECLVQPSRCWPVTDKGRVAAGESLNSWAMGAILIISGRVPTTIIIEYMNSLSSSDCRCTNMVRRYAFRPASGGEPEDTVGSGLRPCFMQYL